jgi:hypothetical protein
MESDTQKLIDICFSLVLTSTKNFSFITKSDEVKAEWAAKQLRLCGFDTKPVGCSWGILQ